jgi:hypothetical protein
MRRSHKFVATIFGISVVAGACSSERSTELAAQTVPAADASTTAPADSGTPVQTPAPQPLPASTDAPAPASTEPPVTEPPAPAFQLYQEVPGPNVPQTTAAVDPNGALGDGVYYVGYGGGETQTPLVTLYQWFSGPACEAKAAELGDECLNGYYVLTDPFAEATPTFAPDVYLTIADSATQLSHWITPEELRVVRAGSPTVETPPSFTGYAAFDFLMTVEGGSITRFEQVWVP